MKYYPTLTYNGHVKYYPTLTYVIYFPKILKKKISKLEMPDVEYIEDLCRSILHLFPASQLSYNVKAKINFNHVLNYWFSLYYIYVYIYIYEVSSDENNSERNSSNLICHSRSSHICLEHPKGMLPPLGRIGPGIQAVSSVLGIQAFPHFPGI